MVLEGKADLQLPPGRAPSGRAASLGAARLETHDSSSYVALVCVKKHNARGQAHGLARDRAANVFVRKRCHKRGRHGGRVHRQRHGDQSESAKAQAELSPRAEGPACHPHAPRRLRGDYGLPWEARSWVLRRVGL